MAIDNTNADFRNKPDQNLPRKGYSINETCKIFGFSRAFYYKLVNSGKIRPVQILGLVIIPAEEIERFTREEMA